MKEIHVTFAHFKDADLKKSDIDYDCRQQFATFGLAGKNSTYTTLMHNKSSRIPFSS